MAVPSVIVTLPLGSPLERSKSHGLVEVR